MASDAADIVVYGRDQHPALVVKVKGADLDDPPPDHTVRQLARYAEGLVPPPRFALLADRRRLRFYRWENCGLHGPVVTLDTPAVLSRYDPQMGLVTLYDDYLNTLVEAWLSDLCDGWSRKSPPVRDALRNAGVFPQEGWERTAEAVRLLTGGPA